MDWPYTEKDTAQNSCNICSTPVPQVYDEIRRWWYPISLYWNAERQEVYCSAKHSLERHQNAKRQTAQETPPKEAIKIKAKT